MRWFDWLIVAEPRGETLGAQGPYLLYAYTVSYGLLSLACAWMAILFWWQRGHVLDLIPRRELWVFWLFIGSLSARYACVLLTLYVGVYWLDALVLAISTAFALAAVWITTLRLFGAEGGRHG